MAAWNHEQIRRNRVESTRQPGVNVMITIFAYLHIFGEKNGVFLFKNQCYNSIFPKRRSDLNKRGICCYFQGEIILKVITSVPGYLIAFQVEPQHDHSN
jgi:hypothetical protein